MTSQEAKYNPITYQLEEYKEYFDGNLILHTVYDENNNSIFHGDCDGWMRRKFAKGCKNNTGEIVMYEDSNGGFRYVRWHGKRKTLIKNKFGKETKFDGREIPTEWIEINVVTTDGMSLFELNASRVVGTPHFYANHYKENGNYFTIEYARTRFEEIYYHDASLGDKRKIIHVDEAQRITEYKHLMYEFNIIMCSKSYRVDSRSFRTFIPRY